MDFFKWLPVGMVQEVTALDLAKNRGIWKIIDVRTKREFDNGHIEGAIHLPITAFTDENVRNLDIDKRDKVIAVCRSAHRSIPAVRKLKLLGFNAHQLKGGMLSWQDKGLPEIID